jgi:hypothetical protein
MSRSWWRAKPQGRFLHMCKGGCSGFLKIKGVHCYGCGMDWLLGLPAGIWREEEKTERRGCIPPNELEKTCLFV